MSCTYDPQFVILHLSYWFQAVSWTFFLSKTKQRNEGISINFVRVKSICCQWKLTEQVRRKFNFKKNQCRQEAKVQVQFPKILSFFITLERYKLLLNFYLSITFILFCRCNSFHSGLRRYELRCDLLHIEFSIILKRKLKLCYFCGRIRLYHLFTMFYPVSPLTLLSNMW